MHHRNQIKEWLHSGEGPNLDYKLHITAPHKIARNLVAFANSHGGYLLTGVDDSRRVLGVNVDEEQYQLDIAATRYCSPSVVLEYEPQEIGGKTLLIAYVPESRQKPHFAVDKNGQYKLFVRIKDQCVEPLPGMEKALRNGDLNWLNRNTQYLLLKRELGDYLNQHLAITVAQYASLKKCSERNAMRTLFDLILDGFLQTKDEQVFRLA